LAGAGLYLLLNVILVRLLEPEDVGFFFICLSVATGAALFAQMGVSQAATKLISEALSLGRYDILSRLVTKILVTCSIGILLVALMLFFGVGDLLFSVLFRSPHLSALLPWVTFWMATTALLIVLSEAFRGFHDIRSAVLLGGSQSSGVLSVGITILVWIVLGLFGVTMDLGTVIKSLVGVSAVVIFFALFRLARQVNIAKCMQSNADGQATISNHLLPLLPSFFLVSATVYVLQQSDLWVVAAIGGPEQTAIYGSVSRLVFAIGLPLMIVNGVVPPIIAELLAQGNGRSLERILRRVTTLATIVAAVGVTIVILAGERILLLLFGSYYVDGYPILVILSLGKLVNVMAGSSGLVLLMGGQHRLAMLIGVSIAIPTLIIASFTATRYGSIGVAVVFAVSLVIQNALMVFAAKRTLDVRTYAGWFSLRELRRLQ